MKKTVTRDSIQRKKAMTSMLFQSPFAKKYKIPFHYFFKDTYREKAPSNKTPELTKITDMGI